MPEIKQLDELTDEELESLVGKHAVFGGRGLIDGLKDLNKYSSHTITGIEEIEGYGKCIYCRAYNSKKGCFLPRWAWNQKVAILTEKEYKELPKWS